MEKPSTIEKTVAGLLAAKPIKPSTVLAVIRGAIKVYETYEWTTGTSFRSKDGREVGLNNSDIRSVCANAALYLSEQACMKEFFGIDVIDFNLADGTVLQLYDEFSHDVWIAKRFIHAEMAKKYQKQLDFGSIPSFNDKCVTSKEELVEIFKAAEARVLEQFGES